MNYCSISISCILGTLFKIRERQQDCNISSITYPHTIPKRKRWRGKWWGLRFC